jgi:hypothetical protein
MEGPPEIVVPELHFDHRQILNAGDWRHHAARAGQRHRIRRRSHDLQLYDVELDGRVVDCGISGPTMDNLIGTKGGSLEERNSQFAELRDKIEQGASDIFDRNATQQVRIFS